jgi:hypothetical protein
LSDSYLAEVIQQARDEDFERERSQQKEMGWSDIAGCRAYMGYRLDGEWATDDTDEWRAIAGTALHDGWLTPVRRAALDRVGHQAEFGPVVEYRGVRGHPDEVNYTLGEITDFKFPTLSTAKLFEDAEVLNQRFAQPMGYAAAVMETERWKAAAPPHRVDRPWVRLLVCPVDGKFSDWKVYERDFDRDLADAAVERYLDTLERRVRGERLPQDMPWHFCERACEFFSLCRGGPEPDDLPEIKDPELAAAVEMYGLAKEAASEADRTKKEMRAIIHGLRGKARGWKVYTSRGGSAKVPDMARIEADYAESDMDVPMKREPRAGALNVNRIKQ